MTFTIAILDFPKLLLFSVRGSSVNAESHATCTIAYCKKAYYSNTVLQCITMTVTEAYNCNPTRKSGLL